MLTGKVLVKDLKTFEKQLGEELGKRALSMDQEFFLDFAKALNDKAEARNSWRDSVYTVANIELQRFKKADRVGFVPLRNPFLSNPKAYRGRHKTG